MLVRRLQPSPLERAGELGARADAELLVRVGEVGLDGAVAEEELRGDLLVRVAGGDELGDLALPGAQRGEARSGVASAGQVGRSRRASPEQSQLAGRLVTVAVGTALIQGASRRSPSRRRHVRCDQRRPGLDPGGSVRGRRRAWRPRW